MPIPPLKTDHGTCTPNGRIDWCQFHLSKLTMAHAHSPHIITTHMQPNHILSMQVTIQSRFPHTNQHATHSSSLIVPCTLYTSNTSTTCLSPCKPSTTHHCTFTCYPQQTYYMTRPWFHHIHKATVMLLLSQLV